MMKKWLRNKYGWLLGLGLVVLVNILMAFVHFRLDLTSEKRFTLSQPTLKLLKGLDDRVRITVYLDGKMPAGFRKLAGSTSDMLQEFKEIAGNYITYSFTRPGEGLPDSSKANLFDSLRQMGINPTNVKAQSKEGEGMEERLIFPGAIIQYKDRAIGVDFLQGQSNIDGIQSLNNAEALLEYKLASGIRKVTIDSIPVVGYLIGNDEPFDYSIADLVNTLRSNYIFRFLPIDSVTTIPGIFDALLLVKPLKGFSESQKLKLDQYIMHGGKMMWMLDNLYASMDSLERSEGRFIAFDLGLNLEDQLFKYGARINRDLVQDLQCDQIPSVIGSVGNKPQMQLLPWPYFPLLRSSTGHPISRNLDYVVSKFPQSIDTVRADGINKTFLLSTSPASRILSTPAIVEWASIRNESDLQTFNQNMVPVSVLLEGRFHSLFTNRISTATADSLSQLYQQPFLTESVPNTKMIVVSDGDIALNDITQSEGPLPMGMNRFTKQQYANKEFLLNALEYLVDPSGILETRSKDYVLRLLDKKRVETTRTFYVLLGIAFPMLVVIIFIAAFQFYRRKKFQPET